MLKFTYHVDKQQFNYCMTIILFLCKKIIFNDSYFNQLNRGKNKRLSRDCLSYYFTICYDFFCKKCGQSGSILVRVPFVDEILGINSICRFNESNSNTVIHKCKCINLRSITVTAIFVLLLQLLENYGQQQQHVREISFVHCTNQNI